MRNRRCPNRNWCIDYECTACETCDLGNHILKLHRKIDRLKVKNKKLEAENKDLRKQSEGEWIRQEKKKGNVAPEAVCSNCGRDVEYQVIDGKWAFENYCSHCGAKMKGGAT